MFHSQASNELDQTAISGASDWDMAVRYQELKRQSTDQLWVRRLRETSANAILRKAQEVLGTLTHRQETRISDVSEVPPEATGVELDLESTLDESPLLASKAATNGTLWVRYQIQKSEPLVLCVDTSLSMTGEKLALTAVALAVVLIQFPDDPIGLVVFETEAQTLKRPEERSNIQRIIERFLDLPGEGYTHLESGLQEALKQVQGIRARGTRKPASTFLLTDGKYTAGKDPAYLAQRFPRLVVLKMGDEKASLSLCKDLARGGKGYFHEVSDLRVLPRAMMGAVRSLLIQ